VTGKWTGLREALANVHSLGRELAQKDVIVPALKEVARPLRDEIVRAAPRSRDSKHMADTFIVKESEGRVLVGPKGGRGSVGFVAPLVEFGTYKMAARPFIRPAYDAWKGTYAAEVVRRLEKRFKSVLRRNAKRKAA
jgi:HK97 gp10 family phage protein